MGGGEDASLHVMLLTSYVSLQASECFVHQDVNDLSR